MPFKEYLTAKWEWSERRAYQLIDAAEIRLKLPNLPLIESQNEQDVQSALNETQMRQLGRLKSPTKAKAIAERVVKEVKERKKKGEKAFFWKEIIIYKLCV